MVNVDPLKLYTFRLPGGAKVTYAGFNEKQAYIRALTHYPGIVTCGELAERCVCNAAVLPRREAGKLICGNPDCAGVM